MPCYYPRYGWRAKNPNPATGKYPIVFSKSAAQIDSPVTTSCGKCVGCRLQQSRETALRCEHEVRTTASSGRPSIFITLTYNEEHLPPTRTILKEHPQKFIKDLRNSNRGIKIRYLMTGEYGDPRPQNGINPFTDQNDIGRPHYHGILFGYAPDDGEIHSRNKYGDPIYTSSKLDKVWGRGNCHYGAATQESAAYVARYSMKKQGGEDSLDYYGIVDPKTGERIQRNPEFSLFSTSPGLGHDFFHKHQKDFNKGYITMQGVKSPIPRYYEKLMSRLSDESIYDRYKERKRQELDLDNPENHVQRLKIKEDVKKRKIQRLQRKLD